MTAQVNGSDFETTKKVTKFDSVPNNKESSEKSRFKESKPASEMNRFGKTQEVKEYGADGFQAMAAAATNRMKK